MAGFVPAPEELEREDAGGIRAVVPGECETPCAMGGADPRCVAASDCRDGASTCRPWSWIPRAGRTGASCTEGQQIEADSVPVEVPDGHALVAARRRSSPARSDRPRPSLPDPEAGARCSSKVSSNAACTSRLRRSRLSGGVRWGWKRWWRAVAPDVTTLAIGVSTPSEPPPGSLRPVPGRARRPQLHLSPRVPPISTWRRGSSTSVASGGARADP